MANRYLLPVYKYIFDEPFVYSSFEKRLKMQKAIYLLQEMGVPISDYGFSWYKHGPYSQALLDDAYIANSVNSARDLSALSTDNLFAIKALKRMMSVPDNTMYNEKEWCECLASLHYLRKNVLPRRCSEQDVLSLLAYRKPHLNDERANHEALVRLEYLYN